MYPVLTGDVYQNLEWMINGKVGETAPIIRNWNPKVLQVEPEELLSLWTDKVASQAVVYVGDYQAHHHREHETKSDNVTYCKMLRCIIRYFIKLVVKSDQKRIRPEEWVPDDLLTPIVAELNVTHHQNSVQHHSQGDYPDGLEIIYNFNFFPHYSLFFFFQMVKTC